MAIYLPRQPTFMEQFSPYMNNIMKSIMMGVENRREDEATARGYIEKGYTETTPMTPAEEGQLQPAGEQAAYAARKPDVTVSGRGLMGMPERGFKRPVEPKMTFGVEKGTKGQDWAIIRKGKEIVKVERIKKEKSTHPALVKGYEYALQQHKDGLAKHPGSYTEWSKRQKRAGATRISIGEKVKEQTQKQIAKGQTGIRFPKFKEDAKKEIMRTPDSDLWEPGEVELKTREEMDRRIRNLYPGKKIDFKAKKRKDGTEVVGWWIGNKLIRLAE